MKPSPQKRGEGLKVMPATVFPLNLIHEVEEGERTPFKGSQTVGGGESHGKQELGPEMGRVTTRILGMCKSFSPRSCFWITK